MEPSQCYDSFEQQKKMFKLMVHKKFKAHFLFIWTNGKICHLSVEKSLLIHVTLTIEHLSDYTTKDFYSKKVNPLSFNRSKKTIITLR